MPINPDKKIAFIHIPRTGGTYIEYCMGVHADRPGSGYGVNYNKSGDLVHLFGRNLQHLTLSEVVDLLGDASSQYKWLVIIRNPADRLKSIICHTFKRPEALKSKRLLVAFLFEMFFVKMKNFYKGRRKNGQISIDSPKIQHLKPQISYLKRSKRSRDIDVDVHLFEELKKIPLKYDCMTDLEQSVPPNASKKASMTKLNGRVIYLVSKILYSKDWKLYERLLENRNGKLK